MVLVATLSALAGRRICWWCVSRRHGAPQCPADRRPAPAEPAYAMPSTTRSNTPKSRWNGSTRSRPTSSPSPATNCARRWRRFAATPRSSTRSTKMRSLDQDQMAGMVNHLRKAGERMEELIGAMLDVSQIDVNAMNLHFAETTLESVVRMAIEPLTEAIKERKITLSARGLRGLPRYPSRHAAAWCRRSATWSSTPSSTRPTAGRSRSKARCSPNTGQHPDRRADRHHRYRRRHRPRATSN